MAKGVLEHGVTGIVPTLVTSSPEVYRATIPKLRPKPGSTEGAAILGAHLEGDTSDDCQTCCCCSRQLSVRDNSQRGESSNESI